MMNISSVLEDNFLEHIQGYRPVADMDEYDRSLIEDKLIELGLLEKYSPSPKKSKASKKTNKASKKTNKTSSATKSRDFMRSFYLLRRRPDIPQIQSLRKTILVN